MFSSTPSTGSSGQIDVYFSQNVDTSYSTGVDAQQTDISQRIRDRILADPDASMNPETWVRAYEDSDDEKMAEIRARVDEVVADDGVADALKPWYRQLCKRPCFHDEYLQTFNRPNVELVDINQRPIDYTSRDSHSRAAIIGMLNTLIVAVVGCFLATVIGVLMP